MSVYPVVEAVAKVEAELAAFWSAPDEKTGVVKVRASTLNYVLAVGLDDLEAAFSVCDSLTETHAGRAFVLRMNGRLAPWDAEALVHAECRIDTSVPICYDRITVTFGAMAAERAPSVIKALAMPEVPLIVESGTGASGILVDSLAPLADRVIVDSAVLSPSRIETLIRKSAGTVGDRAFVRSFSWRELVARFFDAIPEALYSIRRVSVARTPGSKQEPASLYIGWLCSRLGWILHSRELARDRNGQTIEIGVVDDLRSDVEPGHLCAVKIEADLHGESVVFECARTSTPGNVRWSMQGARTALHEHRLGYRDESWVLLKAIDSTEGDAVYRQAVLAATQWSAL